MIFGTSTPGEDASMGEDFTFCDLAERLRRADDAAHAADLHARLRRLSETVEGKLEDGVPAAEFARYRDVAGGLTAAMKVLALAAPAERRTD